jgi:biopolymer transport protein ExbB/TolQ
MDVALIETYMYELSNLFLIPVLLTIIVLFLYAFYALGGFLAQYPQRRYQRESYRAALQAPSQKLTLKAYPLLSHYLQHPSCTLEELEIMAAKQLELLRIVTRIAPMLGLVATMIPMGPALKALAAGNVQGISENLIVAFTAVIFGLITASLTYWISSVKKRWLVTEYRDIEALLKGGKAHETA